MNNLENLEADIAYNRGLTAMLDLLKEEKLISSYAHSQGKLKLDSTILSLVDKKLDLHYAKELMEEPDFDWMAEVSNGR